MTKDDDPRLEGRLPEFARMSRRPGIGVGMMHDVASTLLEHSLDTKMIDVPLSLQHGMKKLPLGRFLRRKLRTMIGRDEKTPELQKAIHALEMQPMLEASRDYKKYPKGLDRNWALKNEILIENEGRRIKIQAKEDIFKKRSSL